MNIEKTEQQAFEYATLLSSKIYVIYDKATIKTFWTATREILKIDNNAINDFLGANEYKDFIQSNTSNIEKATKLEVKSREDLILVFDFTNEKLRKAGITIGVERFTEFTNILFLKLISEENKIISDKIPEHIKWNTYKNKNGNELLSYINDVVIPSLEMIFNKQGEETLFSKLQIKDTIALKEIIEKLDKLDLSKIETDIKGDAFEYFIQKYNSSNKDLGEYFTPRHIVNFLVNIAEPKYGEKIYDPFCGTGGILISAFNYIKQDLELQNYLTDTIQNDLKENTIYGSEISSTAKIAKMNMILTGDGHSNILKQDTLKNKVENKYDVILSNIPFNLSVDESDLYYTNTKNGNTQCLEHIIFALNNRPTARAFIIVPEAVLDDPNLLSIRKRLLDNNLLQGIISLPSGVFLPYTTAKTSILCLQGYNGIKTEKIFYYKVQNDGFTLTQRRRKIDGINDIDKYFDSENKKYIDCNAIKNNKNYSLFYFKYEKETPKDFTKLKEITKEVKKKNTDNHETATITNSELHGIVSGDDFWGENFSSVTSKSNKNYKVVAKEQIAYSPPRVNVGSLGINLGEKNIAISPLYVVFEITDKKFLPEYVYLYLKSHKGLEDIRARCYGTVRQTLRFSDLQDICIPVISMEKQKEICNKAKKIKEKEKEILELKMELDIK